MGVVEIQNNSLSAFSTPLLSNLNTASRQSHRDAFVVSIELSHDLGSHPA
jgi:hypothetical protein